MRTSVLTLLGICFALLGVCSAETITVNPDGTADFTTIQAAIIDANDGDTIIVADGTYTGADNRDIVFLGKGVTLRSENGPLSCYIDCQGAGRGFLIHNGEGPDLVIEGFTIMNGYAVEGGGILCDGSSPTILNCIIVNNQADNGGGVSIKDSAGATLKNCVIAQNISSGTGPGGIDCANADLAIINCTIADNSSVGAAAGISLIADSNALITNSILWADSPNELAIDANSTASITYSDIQGAWTGRGNISADPCFTGPPHGPAIPGLVAHWRFDERGGSIAHDSAGDNDGTIYGAQWADGIMERALRFDGIDDFVLVEDHPTLDVRNTFTFSVWVRKEGNGITILSHDPLSISRTGSYNLYAPDDLRIYYRTNFEDGLSTDDDTISLNTWHHIAVVFNADGPEPKMRIYIDGMEKASGNVTTPRAIVSNDLLIGRNGYGAFFNGVIDDLRIYNRPLSADEIKQVCREPAGYHLTPNSPCVDAGDPDNPPNSGETDIDGDKRVVGEAIDMGAYEAHAIMLVAPPQFDFTSPVGGPILPAEHLSIWNAGVGLLEWYIRNDCPWLTVDPNSGETSDEVDTISVTVDPNGLPLNLYTYNLTITDSHDPNNTTFVPVRFLVHSILYVPGEFDSIQAAIDAALEGDEVVVADGVYAGPGNRDLDLRGKAITVRSDNGPSNCIIDCEQAGRGFYIHSGEDPNSVIAGFMITNGYASSNGGGIFCYTTSPTIIDCVITKCYGDRGGGISCYGGAKPTINNCVIADNLAWVGGGIRIREDSHATINSSTIAYNFNTSGLKGDGISFEDYRGRCSATIHNCIVWGNSDSQIEGGTSDVITVSYSDIQGGRSGLGNIDADPCFVGPPDGFDYHLSSNSPCIDMGDPLYVAEPNQTDIDGEPRVISGRLDIGADEAFFEGPLIGPSAIHFHFEANEGRDNPAAQILGIRNAGIGALDWRIDYDCNWLSVEPNAGASYGERNDVTLSVDISDLDRGVYTCDLTISDAQANNSPLIVHPEVVVHAPILELSDNSVSFEVPIPGVNPSDDRFTIRNAGGATLNWQIDYDCNWLTVEPNSGSSISEPNEVTLSVDTSGLTEPHYTCDLVISDPAAENNPQTVQVLLHIISTCFPTTTEYAEQYSEYMECVNNGYDPSCWCNDYGTGNQCYGDAAGDTHSMGYVIYATDLNRMANSWKAKIGDSHLDPCSDFDHKAPPRGYRVYTGDLSILASKWKRTSLPGDCPLTDAENDAR